jgi:hypothetical protein
LPSNLLSAHQQGVSAVITGDTLAGIADTVWMFRSSRFQQKMGGGSYTCAKRNDVRVQRLLLPIPLNQYTRSFGSVFASQNAEALSARHQLDVT